MADNTSKEAKFIKGVAQLAKDLEVTPDVALVLFGRMARLFADHVHTHGTSDKTYHELVEDALNRFASGLGGRVSNVSIERGPDAPKEVH